ncbi:transporter substrate-binding domain-containing protein [Aliiglaciecola sp. 3_MG-2023]|uniref:substrate-binding periplasmic protein n=1 Tax=Aliiglaciecola sp. 3_MG-2023 TaxID=3062644 RepID=UPI0026E47D73|nr:transporter substrate-binding domain-containing protein [Aliiglaciecola sp. 3_MG-2023]MDO6693397.1 transporter substrate-binding domain-containing protein [Aliiglaciecola sp. 3_MG-2023]
METTRTKYNPMIMVSLIGALLLLIAAIVYLSTQPSSGPKVIHLSSGEWAPYSGETLPQKGIASVVVKTVFEQMGYSVDLQFMPWELAYSKAQLAQQNSQIRGTYPYIKTPERENQFYFSDPIIDVPNGIFFHLQHNPSAATISHPSDLQKYAVITLAGYEYTPRLRQYMPKNTCQLKDTQQGFEMLDGNQQWLLLSAKKITQGQWNEVAKSPEAIRLKLSQRLLQIAPKAPLTYRHLEDQTFYVYQFGDSPIDNVNELIQNSNLIVTSDNVLNTQIKSAGSSACKLSISEALVWLAYSSKPKVLIESQTVGESVLTQSMPTLSAKIGFADYIDYVPHSVLFTKNNPNNLALKNQFNDVLNNLKSNPQAFTSLLTQVTNEIDMADSVRLVATGSKQLVLGQRYDRQLVRCLPNEVYTFPKGTKALVRQWPELFLNNVQIFAQQKVIANVLNGPLASKTNLYCFEPTAVQLQ